MTFKIEFSLCNSTEIYFLRYKYYVKHKKIVDTHKIYARFMSMPMQINLDMALVKKKMKLTELSSRIGISITNLSLLKTGKVKGIRFSTLEAICKELECQPGDILEYLPESD